MINLFLSFFTPAHLLQIFKCCIVVVAAYISYGILRMGNSKFLHVLGVDSVKDKSARSRFRTLGNVVTRTGALLIIGAATLLILRILNIDIAPILTGVGIAGLAASIGAQAFVKDMVSGIFILSENQYREGDEVKIGEAEGTVEKLTLRTTTLRDTKGNRYFIPHGGIVMVKVTSGSEKKK